MTAVEIVERQVSLLQHWVDRHLDDAIHEPLRPYLDALVQVKDQDLEPTEKGIRIRRGVASDRRVSIEDAEMRYGHKSKSKRIDGYKEHIARDLDSPAIVGCAVTAASVPEQEGAQPIADAIKRQGTAVVHSLPHIASRKGSTARYVGVRKNLFDLRRTATIQFLVGL